MARCPKCASSNTWKDGLRKIKSGDLQRYICRNCGFRFSNGVKEKSFRFRNEIPGCQICVSPERKAENLVTVEPLKDRLAGATSKSDVKAKLIEHAFWLLKQGYAESTIKGRTKLLTRLRKLGANLYDSESIKEIISKQNWSLGRKANAADAYTCFLRMIGMKWNPPLYKKVRKIPFVPTETEIDQLIAGCNQRMACFLQLLKETGVRCGEATKLKWTETDFVQKCVRVTSEKGSNPRILRISSKLTSMLKTLKMNNATVFGTNSDSMRKSYQRQRKRIATKLRNPRLMQVSFHTFRHWKATMEYSKTKDILHVMQLLGHRNIKNTLVYTQLVNFKDDDYVAKVAHSEREICQLVEAGFEYVCDYGRDKIFRKPK